MPWVLLALWPGKASMDTRCSSGDGVSHEMFVYWSSNLSRNSMVFSYKMKQSMGFLWGFNKILKFPGPMGQLTIQSFGFLKGFLKGFQEDIKISIIIIINDNNTHHHHHHHHHLLLHHHHHHHHHCILACPDARCESGQTSGSCRSIRGMGLSVLHISFGWLDPIVSPFSLVESLLSRIRFA